MLVLDCLIDFDITADHAAVILADRKSKCVISMTNLSSLIPLTATLCCVITDEESYDSPGDIYPAVAFGSLTNR